MMLHIRDTNFELTPNPETLKPKPVKPQTPEALNPQNPTKPLKPLKPLNY